jgi:pantoate--beta-alanine ligase
MEIFETATGLKSAISKIRKQNGTVGFVPTMGALHQGHLSLISSAAEICSGVIVSIFVNPTQFNDPNDLRNYPRKLEKDLEMLSSQGKTFAVFAPEVKEIYPRPDTRIFDFGNLDKVMEGAHRPGHFNGVGQVVSRLFDIVAPDKAFFGEKDFQQLAIIRKMTRDLNYKIDIVPCPIVRENDGLAMSSRNTLLSPEERKHAAKISATLFRSVDLAPSKSVKELTEWVVNEINSDPYLNVEYFQIVDSLTLMSLENWNEPGGKQGCTAVKIGGVRLIDNIKFA